MFDAELGASDISIPQPAVLILKHIPIPAQCRIGKQVADLFAIFIYPPKLIMLYLFEFCPNTISHRATLTSKFGTEKSNVLSDLLYKSALRPDIEFTTKQTLRIIVFCASNDDFHPTAVATKSRFFPVELGVYR